MIRINKDLQFPIQNVLFTFALAAEAGEVFSACRTLICGIGKVSATLNLMTALQQQKPELIVNLGSAGSSRFQKGEIVCCTKFIQRDMDVRPLGYQLYETPLSGLGTVLETGLHMEGMAEATCGTGDNFEIAQRNTPYNVVDMEAYALALVASTAGIPFLSLKYISDGADEQAADDWNVEVHRAATAFGQLLKLPQLSPSAI